MDSFINMHDNVEFTEAQIGKRMKAIERSRYSARQETMLNREASGISLGVTQPDQDVLTRINDFKNFIGECVVLSDLVRSENAAKIQAIEYEAAAARLDKHILSEGAEEYVIEKVSGKIVDLDAEPLPEFVDVVMINEDGEEETVTVKNPAIVETVTIPAIEPIPEFIDNISYDGGGEEQVESVRNPLIVADESERAAAQEIVDSASDDVVEIVATRAQGKN